MSANSLELVPTITSAALASMQAPAASLSVPFSQPSLIVERSRVAGTLNNPDRDDLCAQLNVGQRLELRRAPMDYDDPYSVQVLSKNGDVLGYVAADINEIVSRLMSFGKHIYAVVCSIELVGSWHMVYVEVYLDD